MLALIDAARAKGLKTMRGDSLASNEKMLNLVSGIGFALHHGEDDPSVKRAVGELA
jgi:acetyltransferase